MIKVVISHDVCRESFLRFQGEAIRMVRDKSFSTNEIFTAIAHMAHDDLKHRFGEDIKMRLDDESKDLVVSYYREFEDERAEEAMLFKLEVA